MIETLVARVPGQKFNLTLNDGATIADAFKEAGVTVASSENVQVDGVNTTDFTAACPNCSRIIISAGAKGNG